MNASVKKIGLGLVALVALALTLSARTHWLIGGAIVAIPVLVVYVRLKLSPIYKTAAQARLESISFSGEDRGSFRHAKVR